MTQNSKITEFTPLRNQPQLSAYKKGDVMVVFGELFSRGYANGIVDEAKSRGMKLVYSTVGRRDENNNLRPLTAEEIAEKDQPLINVPLEAGFDLEPSLGGQSPVDQLSGIKMSQWNQVKLDWKQIEESRLSAVKRFKTQVNTYLDQLLPQIPEDANVLFVHTMAGGFPRAKVVMPITNRVFKGFADRFESSETFWKSEIGRLCDMSFNEVTGETLKHLIEMTSQFREQKKAKGFKVNYVAYGYHGTEVLVGSDYAWQSYSPYLQGWAKLHLENIAKDYLQKGVAVSVYNCPEILTNSSSIFLGVEVSLYPLLAALQKEAKGSQRVNDLLSHCQKLLKPEHSLESVKKFTDEYLTSDVIQKWTQYEKWPQHNGPEQMERMRKSSAELIDWHLDPKNLITSVLSEVVFKACGPLMLDNSWNPVKPVWWIGHDVIAKYTAAHSE